MLDRINNLIGRLGLYIHGSKERDGFRVWLNRHDTTEGLASLEVSLGGIHLGGRLKLSADSESPVKVSLGLGPLQVFVGSESRLARRVVKAIEPMLARDWYGHALGEFSLQFYTIDGSWVLRGGFNATGDGPRAREFYVDLKDIILGSMEYTKGEGEPQARTIYLAEGAYDLELRKNESMWKRPRWPFTTRAHSYNWAVTAGVGGRKCLPIPGKGENSYDQDEDAIYSGGIQARNADEAAGAIVGMVMHDRARRAGPGWLPEPPSARTPDPEAAPPVASANAA